MSSASVVSPVASSCGDVVEAAEAAGDVAAVEGLALERGDEPDHVLAALRGDDDDLELLGRQAERHRCEAPVAGDGRQLGRHREAVHLARVITMKPTGWIGTRVPGGSTGRWTPFWPPSRNGSSCEKSPKDVR